MNRLISIKTVIGLGAAAVALLGGTAASAAVQIYNFGTVTPVQSGSKLTTFAAGTFVYEFQLTSTDLLTQGSVDKSGGGTGHFVDGHGSIDIFSTAAAPVAADGSFHTAASAPAGTSEGVSSTIHYTIGEDGATTTPIILGPGKYYLKLSGEQGTGGAFKFLANVNVTAVPEPASWALMILGLAGAGAMMRRQRKLAVATFA